MSTAAPVYHKLPGGGLTWSGRGKLWQGPDHLLEVTSLFVVEHYRRFFFHEARAFVVQRTNVRLIWALIYGVAGSVCGLIAGLFAGVGLSRSAEDWHVFAYFWAGFFALPAFVCFFFLAINLALGPSCRCHIHTATGWHALTAPARLGPALQVQARVFPLIEAAQARPAAMETAAS